jgi:hypothetical protein
LATLRSDQVDVETTSDATGTYNIGYVLNGEWLEYTVNVAAAGAYTLDVRLASDGAGKTMHVEIDGVHVTGAITVPNTTGWQIWNTATVNNINLTQGQHIMRIAFDSDYINLNYVQFKNQVTTNIDLENNLSQTSVSPNPFASIGFKILGVIGEFNYEILALDGQIIEQGKGTSEQLVGTLIQTGTYIITIETAKGKSVHKIVKQ